MAEVAVCFVRTRSARSLHCCVHSTRSGSHVRRVLRKQTLSWTEQTVWKDAFRLEPHRRGKRKRLHLHTHLGIQRNLCRDCTAVPVCEHRKAFGLFKEVADTRSVGAWLRQIPSGTSIIICPLHFFVCFPLRFKSINFINIESVEPSQDGLW